MTRAAPVLAPGTILQFLYLRDRLKTVPPGRFLEVGAGSGELSALLLSLGWRGVAYEASTVAADAARRRNQRAIEAGRYRVEEADWLAAPRDDPADLVISSHVIEHLPGEQEAAYFERARDTLTAAGRAIVLVPASPRHWGIEDDVAGHYRRYAREGLSRRLHELGWQVNHVSGLTFPLSNLLLPISNRLVAAHERDRLDMTALDRTLLSGHRDVPGKTSFPRATRVVLNPVALYPWHILQKACGNSGRALVLYAEATARR